MNYYEIDFGDDFASINHVRICIRGLREPTIEEANAFCAEDVKSVGHPVTMVTPIDSKEAHEFYDLDNEDKLPIFGA